MRPAEIDLQIDELVLHGFSHHDRARIGGAMERELRRLLAEDPARAASTTRAVMSDHGGAIHVAHGASPEAVGAQAAGAVYRALLTGSRPGALSGASNASAPPYAPPLHPPPSPTPSGRSRP